MSQEAVNIYNTFMLIDYSKSKKKGGENIAQAKKRYFLANIEDECCYESASLANLNDDLEEMLDDTDIKEFVAFSVRGDLHKMLRISNAPRITE